MKVFQASLAMYTTVAACLSPLVLAFPGFPDASRQELVVENGLKYSWFSFSASTDESNGTVVLLHGFPDLSYGWRNQIDLFRGLGYDVVAMDMLGYGQTDAPDSLSYYTHRSMADDLAQIVDHVSDQPVILGGHDWGSFHVWRAAMFHPDKFRGLFGLTVPFIPPMEEYVDLSDSLDETPTFGYQLQLREPSTDARLEKMGTAGIRGMLRALHGGSTPGANKPGFVATQGLQWQSLRAIRRSPFYAQDTEDYYIDQYQKNGVSGPLSWYKTAYLNYLAEREYAGTNITFDQPTLFIAAEQDTAIPPEQSENMDQWFSDYERVILNTSHWVHWQDPLGTNAAIEQWMVKNFA
ncbi:hypothetical protein MBLNU230_g3222t1 [Neophaeotheca triangularis]